jgi:peptide methionine sulfoxide reductase MsrA
MDDGFDPILLVSNSSRLEQATCMGCFWATKKVYLEFILGPFWYLLMNMDLGYMGSKVSLD